MAPHQVGGSATPKPTQNTAELWDNLHPKKHKGVLALLGLEFVNKGYIEEVYGKIFAKNMELREKADYDVSFRASEEEAKR